MLGRFNRAGGSQDPTARGRLRRRLPDEGGLHARLGRLAVRRRAAEPSRRRSRRSTCPAASRVSFIPDDKRTEMAPADLPRVSARQSRRSLGDADGPRSLLGHADGHRPQTSGGSRSANGRPRVVLDAGFEPGRVYEVDYAGSGARVAGVGLAAIRDAASAFLHRTDLPVRGRSAYVFGISQSGRFLRQFLHDGFNVGRARSSRVRRRVAAHRRRRPGIVQRALRDAGLLVVPGDALPVHRSRAAKRAGRA